MRFLESKGSFKNKAKGILLEFFWISLRLSLVFKKLSRKYLHNSEENTLGGVFFLAKSYKGLQVFYSAKLLGNVYSFIVR